MGGGIYSQFLEWCTVKGNNFLATIVRWAMKPVFVTLIWKQNDRMWSDITQHCPLNQKPSACKTMGTVFWVAEGCTLVKFLSHEETINAACHLQLVQDIYHAASCVCMERIQKIGWELLSHPGYGPDPAHSDNHLFRSMKDQMQDQH